MSTIYCCVRTEQNKADVKLFQTELNWKLKKLDRQHI